MQTAKRGIVGEVARVLPRLPKYAKLTWLLLKDPNLPSKQRAALMAAVGYSISPLDAIPGVIPVVGQLDDLAVMLFTIRWVLRSVPANRADQYFAQSGLTPEILEEDLHLVKRSGARILRKAVAIMGIAGLWAWGFGKFAGRGILRKLRKLG
ncbi:MAG TPA: DUF1232 domain-containing protein [Armatimonadota bacterium]|nr:DUF1232 domain-containing protein [Armatimonadota bacterium]